MRYLEQEQAKLTSQLEEWKKRERVSDVQVETLGRKLDANFDDVTRGHFHSVMSQSVGHENVEALGIARNNKIWQVTVRTAQSAKQLVDLGQIFVGNQRAELSNLKAPGFKVRIFWLPY